MKYPKEFYDALDPDKRHLSHEEDLLILYDYWKAEQDLMLGLNTVVEMTQLDRIELMLKILIKQGSVNANN